MVLLYPLSYGGLRLSGVLVHQTFPLTASLTSPRVFRHDIGVGRRVDPVSYRGRAWVIRPEHWLATVYRPVATLEKMARGIPDEESVTR